MFQIAEDVATIKADYLRELKQANLSHSCQKRPYFLQRVKYEFCLCRSVDLYGADLGRQTTFYCDYSITALIWPISFSEGQSTSDVSKVIRKKSE